MRPIALAISTACDPRRIRDLAELIDRTRRERPDPVLTGWQAPTAIAPRAVVHEWFGALESGGETLPHSRQWTPPLAILTHLARQSLHTTPGGIVAWIGRRVQPYAPALLGEGDDPALLHASLFIDPRDDASRLWAIELCLRCPGVIATIADGSRLNMAATRRLQLAAADGGGLALLARPPSEIKELSAAALRWLVRREPSPTSCPRWTVALMRCKGLPSGAATRAAAPDEGGSLIVEYSRAACVVRVPPDVGDRPRPQEAPAGRQTA